MIKMCPNLRSDQPAPREGYIPFANAELCYRDISVHLGAEKGHWLMTDKVYCGPRGSMMPG
jgi:hypothetical protein